MAQRLPPLPSNSPGPHAVLMIPIRFRRADQAGLLSGEAIGAASLIGGTAGELACGLIAHAWMAHRGSRG